MRRTVNAGYGERTSLSESFAEQRVNNKRPSLLKVTAVYCARAFVGHPDLRTWVH